jgi:hypothetical protein
MSRQEKKKDKKRKTKFKGLDIDFIKMKMAALQQGNRFREAIIYAYYNYLQEVQGFFNVGRRASQTAREYAMDLVKQAKLPPAIIYPFTTLFEEARFGRQELDANRYAEALKLFLNLHDLMMGGPPNIPEPAPSAQ